MSRSNSRTRSLLIDLLSLYQSEESSGLSMGPRGCPAALGKTRDFFSAALARARECGPQQGLVHRGPGSTEHQAAQYAQLVSSLSGTSGGKSKKKTSKGKLESGSGSSAQLLILTLFLP